MTDRRDFARALTLGLLSSPIMTSAQIGRSLPVVGTLTGSVRGKAFRNLVQGLLEASYVEGRNFIFESRFVEGNPAALADFARDLVKLKVNVLYVVGPAAAKAARDATLSIPIVALDLESDPVKNGWARSFAQPGGNLTGLFLDVPALAGKWLELLRTAVPAVRRIGALWDSSTGPAQLLAAKAVAGDMGIEVLVMELRSANRITAALRDGIAGGVKAIVILGSPMMDAAVNAKQIADFTAGKRLPAISPFRSFSDAGGLMSYGPNMEDFQPRAAGFIAKILKGANPGDLAIERPTKFEMVINLKAAKTLDLAIPQALLLRADEVIE